MLLRALLRYGLRLTDHTVLTRMKKDLYRVAQQKMALHTN